MFTIDKRAAVAAKVAGRYAAGIRFVLNAVRVEQRGDGYAVTATDGHRLIRCEGPSLAAEFPEVPGFDASANGATAANVPAKDFADCLRGLPKAHRSMKEVFRHAAVTLEPTRATFCGTDLTRASVQPILAVEGSFPDADEIIPATEPEFRVGVNADLLAGLLQAVADFADRRHDRTVVLEFWGPVKAMRATAASEGRKATGMLMPVLIE